MRHGYSTITPAAVHAVTRRTLERALGWTDYKGSATGPQLLDLVLRVARTTRPLFAVVTRYFGFSHETARQAVRANRGSGDQRTARLVDALHPVAGFTRRDRKRRWTVAIDLHYVPFYGDRTTPGILGGPKKAGTAFSHAYATCARIHTRRRSGCWRSARAPSRTIRCGPSGPRGLARANRRWSGSGRRVRS
ncbi:hypothetical protein VT84_35255 [Gemmata sp. SH-PL17]|uniref:hypothetical protein n=1 Tax=Gemmata sp. SH-PL17 TaxID=1630693 RepID=UPI00078D14B4|nr:hypothetical protein [Gemmata sp. SH-PL17]AMV29706.1 hypothetical protein VT84_35255 [Gemmata sp. SH-PL17]